MLNEDHPVGPVPSSKGPMMERGFTHSKGVAAKPLINSTLPQAGSTTSPVQVPHPGQGRVLGSSRRTS